MIRAIRYVPARNETLLKYNNIFHVWNAFTGIWRIGYHVVKLNDEKGILVFLLEKSFFFFFGNGSLTFTKKTSYR